MTRNQISSVAFGQVNSAVRILPGASVSVVSASGGPVTLYADEDGAETVANPFTCDALGRYDFFVSSSEISYTITVTLGPVSYTWVFYTTDDTVAGGLIYEETWTDLVGRSADLDGAAAEVTNDAGTHLAATDSGYDGGEVANLGRYRWNADWGRWERLADESAAVRGQPFESVSAVELASIPGTVSLIYVGSDGVLETYLRSNEPADIQSADGAWWKVVILPIRTSGEFTSRAELVAEIASGALDGLPEGRLVSAGGLTWEKMLPENPNYGADPIADMPGYAPPLGSISPGHFGAVGDGVTDDTTAWGDFQSAVGLKIVPDGEYRVDGAVKRFDQGVYGNGEFSDADAIWDQVTGDRVRDSFIVHRRDIDHNTDPASPLVKSQTQITYEEDAAGTVGKSFKYPVGTYYEATYDGYYDTKSDTNQNFTIHAARVQNNMAGLFGALPFAAYVADTDDSGNPDIATMGGSKNGCMFLQFDKNGKYEHGGYMFGLEVYAQNTADEADDIPYTNSDEFSFGPGGSFQPYFTAGVKLYSASDGAPISAAIFTHGSGTAKHGAWNGIVVGGSGFRINNDSEGAEGTVAINLASHRTGNGFSDIGVKFRTNNRHTYFREGHKSRASKTRLMYELGSCGLSIESGAGTNSYIHLSRGVTSAADGGSPLVSGQIDTTSSWTRIQSNEGELHLGSNGGAQIYVANSARFAPATALDGTQHLGGADRRWDTVYATNGSINTSDENSKSDIEAIPDEWLDAWEEVEWVRYKFNDAVALKGDGARWHVGLVAQRVRDAFEANGIDPFKIGLLCYDEWEAQEEVTEVSRREVKPAVYEQVIVSEAVYRVLGDGTKEIVEPAVYTDGEEIEPAVYEEETFVVQEAREAGSRYGIRYDEAAALEAAYQRRKIAQLEAKIAALNS